MTPEVAIISLILRIAGMWYCSKKANKLNRDYVRWGLFGFVSPLLATIWIQFMKPIIKWEDQSK
jgi:hypothetical protein